VVSFTPLLRYHRGKSPSTNLIGGWVDPIAGLDDVEKREFLILQGLEIRPLGRPARRQSLSRLPFWYMKPCIYSVDTEASEEPGASIYVVFP
jgi:hypothetical protein